MTKKEKEILSVFKPYLWSFDVSKIDLEKNKKRIIINVLNLGSKKATDLLFEVYDEKEIRNQVKNSLSGEWNKKALNYWSIILGVNIKKQEHVLRHSR